ncbi:MAG TPA: acylphosphatase [Kiritimatiellia bacterium]|nr:acylphosphatase [Kiritimatiellia bacterium]HMO98025.1 acylphosphatase [Kiritimatiellia bacterium]HMP96550.1 acylphosphatase [Kiritimatiellia bacterium]
MTKSEKNKMPRRLVATFDGRVQGVGFRFTTVEIARGFAVTGYVQNMMEGSVRLVAEGEEEELTRFLNALRDSHIFRYVTREDLSWPTATGEFDSFVIRYS